MDPPPPLPPSAPPHSATVAPASAAAANANANATIIHPNHPDSVESSPCSRIVEPLTTDEPLPHVPGAGAKLRLMCSYGGHIMPRPHDKSLCYVGGDTRIVVVDRHSSLKDLCTRLSRSLLHGRPFTLKYQLPNEDLDNLITVTTDEDLENMIEEYDRIAAAASNPLKPSPSRLRVFVFFPKPEAAASMGSLLDDAKSETWFVDALNNSGILSRVVSESTAVDCFVNLDEVPISGSSNNLEAQGAEAESRVVDNSKQVKNFHDVHSLPGSPIVVENNSSYGSSSSSPSMANLPPIRVRVDDNGASRLQQEHRAGVGVMEEQFAQMSFATASGVKQDDGSYAISSSAVAAVPVSAIPAAVPMTVASTAAAMVTADDNMHRVVSDDERSDHGAPATGGYRKPPLPLQLVQPRTNGGGFVGGGGGGGGLSLPSPDSVASDSSVASTNSFTKTVYYQEQVQAAHVDNNKAPPVLPDSKSEISDQIPGLQREQFQDSGYMLPPQLDQNQQLQQQQQQQQFVHASTHYIHHPAATGQVPISSYYPVYAPSSQQQLHPIGQQQYPVYVMPVGPTQPYNMTLQPNMTDPSAVASGRPLIPQSAAASAAYKDGTPPIYPPKSATPAIPEVAPSVYKAPVASNPAFVQIPSNQFQQQYVGLSQIHHPPQHIAVAPSAAAAANYGYEYGGPAQDQAYYTQQQISAPLPPQYQSMTPAAAAAALSDASRQFPADSIQQTNRTSQPV